MAHHLDTIQIINPTEMDFTEVRDKGDLKANKLEMIVYGNHPYSIKSGEKKRYQRLLADHITKHITDQIIRKEREKGNKHITYNDEDFRKKCWDKIQIGVVDEFQPGGGSSEGAQVAAQQEQIARQHEDKMERMQAEIDALKKPKVGRPPKSKTDE